MLRLLKRFVRCESPTDSKSAVDNFGRMVAGEWRKRGAKVRYIRRQREGNHLRVSWPARRVLPNQSPVRSNQILVLGHLDTVYQLGAIENMPFRASRGRA